MTKRLAILGGSPTFDTVRHVGRPNVPDRVGFMRRANEMLDRLWLSNNGPLVREFEERIATFVGVKHCICVCNATVGLEVMIRAAGLGGEVILPSFTFVATAHALQWQGITPVFADIDPSTHNIDPAQIERHITPRTTGILATHVWGRPCAIDELTALAKRRGLKLLFDAAHGFGSSHNGGMIGGFGDAEVFSFHATKFLNSCEGGAIVTNDDALAERVRIMINFGFAGYDNVIHLGVNGKMTEVCAAMGLANLSCVDDLVQTNLVNYSAYKNELAGIAGIALCCYPAGERSNYQYIVVEVDSDVAPLDRDALVAVLHAENILARKYFWPGCHKMEPYKTIFPDAYTTLPNTETVARRVIVLPTGTSVCSADIGKVGGILKNAFDYASQVKAALGVRRDCP